LANDATDAAFEDASEGANDAQEQPKAVVDDATKIADPAMTADAKSEMKIV